MSDRTHWLPAALCLLAGCSAPAPAPEARLITSTVPTVRAVIEVHGELPAGFEHSSWRFVQVDRDRIADADARLEFRDGRLSGSTGCNRLNSAYRRQGSLLHLEPVGLTRRFCQDKVRQESLITGALRNTRQVAVVKANGYLLLLDGRREILAELAPAAP